jgi:hypothetical protein
MSQGNWKKKWMLLSATAQRGLNFLLRLGSLPFKGDTGVKVKCLKTNVAQWWQSVVWSSYQG